MNEKERIINILNEHLESDDFQAYLFYVRGIINDDESFGEEVPEQIKAFALDLLDISKYLKINSQCELLKAKGNLKSK
jgi:hypothetical protein